MDASPAVTCRRHAGTAAIRLRSTRCSARVPCPVRSSRRQRRHVPESAGEFRPDWFLALLTAASPAEGRTGGAGAQQWRRGPHVHRRRSSSAEFTGARTSSWCRCERYRISGTSRALTASPCTSSRRVRFLASCILAIPFASRSDTSLLVCVDTGKADAATVEAYDQLIQRELAKGPESVRSVLQLDPKLQKQIHEFDRSTLRHVVPPR